MKKLNELIALVIVMVLIIGCSLYCWHTNGLELDNSIQESRIINDTSNFEFEKRYKNRMISVYTLDYKTSDFIIMGGDKEVIRVTGEGELLLYGQDAREFIRSKSLDWTFWVRISVLFLNVIVIFWILYRYSIKKNLKIKRRE